MPPRTDRKPHPDCVEYILEDGRRFAWSDSNVQYEEVPEDGASFTLLRKRLTEAQDRLRLVEDTARAFVRTVDPRHDDVVPTFAALREVLDGPSH